MQRGGLGRTRAARPAALWHRRWGLRSAVLRPLAAAAALVLHVLGVLHGHVVHVHVHVSNVLRPPPPPRNQPPGDMYAP